MRYPNAFLPVLVVQVICAFFFVGDLAGAMVFFGELPFGWALHEAIEALAALGLIIGVFFGFKHMRHGWQQKAEAENKLNSLSGSFRDLVVSHFNSWGLTKSERDVSLFLIKGFSTAEIAKFRGTSEGTIKAQSNAIYNKADVTSRAQLVSILIDDLMQDDDTVGHHWREMGKLPS